MVQNWTFYLGAPEPAWLHRVRDVPLFVSQRRMTRCGKAIPATTSWALDSGAYSELTMHGRWQFTAEDYVKSVRRYVDEVGGLAWAAPMDWPTEPQATSKSGLPIIEHIHRTVGSYLDLRGLDPTLPIIPVVQGQTLSEYLRCVELYEDAGVDLAALPLVGVGSVCRRQKTPMLLKIFRVLRALGLRLHGFGLSHHGIMAAKALMVSSDSMAWSYAARALANGREGGGRLPGCTHRACNYCLPYALDWRERLFARITARTATASMVM